jgi:RNA 2',3'-cyclic 3'-phosphodiesterase
VRLFVAVLPDGTVDRAVDEALELALRRAPDAGRWRPVASSRRHVTLRFHADADPAEVSAALRSDLAGRRAPTLRCAGAGVFGTALWIGVHPDDTAGWADLVAATGADPDAHVAHLTVARARGVAPAVPPGLAEHRGPAWTATELVLVASGVPYRVLDRFPLVGGGARPGGGTGGDGAVGPHG